MRLRAIEPEEALAFDEAVMAAFHAELSPEDEAMYGQIADPPRQLVWDDDGRIVATAASFRRTLTVPGGSVPAAAVTAVGVQPTHRRRGLLTALMRHQLDEVHEGTGEPVAILWASEPAIYPRFGYGPGTRAAALELDTGAPMLRDDLDVVAGPTEVLAPGDALATMRALHARVAAERPGMLDRPGPWWNLRLHDPERRREGAGPLRAVVVEDGYALFGVRSGFASDPGATVVRELVAGTPAAAAALWRFLAGLDLVRSLRWRLASPDEPLQHMVRGGERVRLALEDGLWLRLVDVAAALRARALAPGAEPVVLDVADAFCPWNAGRVGLDGATASGPPDLELDVGALAAAYLGDSSFAALAAAGRVRERTAGAIVAASQAWATPRAPWCPEVF